MKRLVNLIKHIGVLFSTACVQSPRVCLASPTKPPSSRISPDALITVTPHDGRITFWSRGAEGVFGYSRAEVFGRSLVEVLVPIEHQEFERKLLRSAAEKAPATYEEVRLKKETAAFLLARPQ
jgi:PAS domain-containing protein